MPTVKFNNILTLQYFNEVKLSDVVRKFREGER
jgi:hypothetical protein